MHLYSPFWLAFCAGLRVLSPAWAERDELVPDLGPFDDEAMAIWLRRSNEEHRQIVASYMARPRRQAA